MLICVDKRSAPGQPFICVQGVESQEASRKWPCPNFGKNSDLGHHCRKLNRFQHDSQVADVCACRAGEDQAGKRVVELIEKRV